MRLYLVIFKKILSISLFCLNLYPNNYLFFSPLLDNMSQGREIFIKTTLFCKALGIEFYFSIRKWYQELFHQTQVENWILRIYKIQHQTHQYVYKSKMATSCLRGIKKWILRFFLGRGFKFILEKSSKNQARPLLCIIHRMWTSDSPYSLIQALCPKVRKLANIL